jgi:hypothetical protein
MKKFKLKFLKNKNLFSFIVPVIIIALLVGVVMVKRNRDRMVTLKTTVIPEIITKLTGDPTIKVKDITNFKIASGLYQFELNLDMNGTPRTFTSYMTKDEKIFFTTGTVLSELGKTPDAAQQQQPAQAKLTCADVKKADTAKVTAYVVSGCPFGLQMQRVMNKAITEQPALASLFDVKYIGAITDGKITSMHGDEEAKENLRQICIREEQKALYWPYVACYMKEGKTDACLTQTGVNTSNLTACTTDAKRGFAFAQKDFDLQAKYSIGSSPTLLVNDSQIVSEFDFGGRTADALKQVACCGSTTAGSYCSKDLTKTEVATAFSVTEEAAAGGAAAANCAPAATN